MRRLLVVFLFGCLLLAGGIPACAQDLTTSNLYAFQTTSFPTMTAMLDVYDASGSFVTGLASDAFTLLEDDQVRPLSNLEELQPGAEFALALDPGPYFAYQDSRAVNRYSKVLQVLKEWAVTHPDSLRDDQSLVPNGSETVAHLTATTAFLDAIETYQPSLREINSTPETLARALDVVSEPTSQVGSKPVVLYITSLPEEGNLPALQDLVQRAAALKIRVCVWMVASQDSLSTTGATALKDLAIQTGGQFSLFSGMETLPSPETYLAPVRHAYRLEYVSGILSSGGHTLAVQVNLNGGSITSESLSFDLDVQAPNPILLSPPEQIIRSAPDEHTVETSSFLPTRQAIDIVIEFPDGKPRPLIRTVLYVDGSLVDENTSEPFDHFTWDISGYATSCQHFLTVEAVDNLGLSKVSLGVPVMLTVIHPKTGLLPWLSRNRQWVALGAIFLAGSGLGVILSRNWARKKRSKITSRRPRLDPLTQTVQNRQEQRSFHLPRGQATKPADAYLIRLKEDGQPVNAQPIPITVPEMTFGSDPVKVTRILDDPSVSPLHARLREENGKYILSDEKSVAGTWVNYEQLAAPRRLQHNDVIHLGRILYRFMLRKPPELPKPKIILIKK
jgi:hypothetical protein